MREPEGFREFVATRSPALVRTAGLLTGDPGTAQDLVQATLVRVWSRWRSIRRQDAPEAYVRRVMVTTWLTWSRRKWRGETPYDDLPDRAAPVDAFAGADLRHLVAAALATLPPRQRAVVVLRYFDDLTEAQTAEALGVAVGTVKSQAAKALARLRACPELWTEEEVGRDDDGTAGR